MKSVYSAVRTRSLNKAVCASSLKGLYAALYPGRAQILSVVAAAFPMKGSLIEMGYSGNAINFIVNSSVIFLFVFL